MSDPNLAQQIEQIAVHSTQAVDETQKAYSTLEDASDFLNSNAPRQFSSSVEAQASKLSSKLREANATADELRDVVDSENGVIGAWSEVLYKEHDASDVEYEAIDAAASHVVGRIDSCRAAYDEVESCANQTRSVLDSAEASSVIGSAVDRARKASREIGVIAVYIETQASSVKQAIGNAI